MHKPSTLITKIDERWFLVGVLGLAIISTLLFAILPAHLLLLVVLLVLALPLSAVLLLREMRGRALVMLIVLVPLVGIVKGITGVRFAPLIFDLGILAACGLHLADQIIRRRAWFGWADLLFVAFMGLAFVQMLNPNVPSAQAAIEGFRKFAYMGIAFYVGRSVLTAREVGWLEQFVLIISAPIALYAIKQFFLPSELDFRIIDLATAGRTTYLMGGQLRPFATLPGPFHLGLYMIVAGLLVVNLLLSQRLSPSRTLLMLGLLAIQMVALIMTRTKSNWVGMAVGVALLIFFVGGFGALLRLRLRLRQIITATSVTIVLIVVMAVLAFSGRFTVINDALEAVLDPLNAPTFVYRLELWEERILPAMRERPLLGWGTSAAGEGLSQLYTGALGSQHFGSHNLYFKIMLELGLAGLILFGALVGLCLRRGWRAARSETAPGTATRLPIATSRWAFAVVVSFLFAGLAAPVLDAYPANYYFWLLLGLLARAPQPPEPALAQPEPVL